MLAKRIIPTLLCRNRTLIKGKQFRSWRIVGLVTQSVRIFEARGADELILLDIGATPEKRSPDLEMIAELADVCFMPLAIGGGVRTVEDAQKLLRAGADKVVIGQAALENPQLVSDIANKAGSQAVIVAIDVRDDNVVGLAGQFDERKSPVGFALCMEQLGAGELIVTDVGREGTMTGYNLTLIESLRDYLNIPVIAHGGAGSYEDLHDGIGAGADAVAAGAMYQFTEATPRGAAEYLKERGVVVRL